MDLKIDDSICYIPKGQIDHLVVFFHGYGADGHNLLPLYEDFTDILPHAAFYAPNAPFPCEIFLEGHQWFSLANFRPDLLFNTGSVQAKSIFEFMLRGVKQIEGAVHQFLDHLLDKHKLPPSKLILVGFSQGAALALHLGLTRAPSVGSVVSFSGAFIGLDDETHIKAKPPTILIHGMADMTMPVSCLNDAYEHLSKLEVPVECLAIEGLGHVINGEGIDFAKKNLIRTLSLKPF